MDSTNWRGDFEKALEGEGAKGERQAQVWTVLSPVTAARVTVPVMVSTFIHPAARAACSAACCAFCNEAVLCSISTYWRCTQRADASLVFWVSRGWVLLLLLVAVAFLAAAFFHLAQAFTGWVLGTGSS